MPYEDDADRPPNEVMEEEQREEVCDRAADLALAIHRAHLIEFGELPVPDGDYLRKITIEFEDIAYSITVTPERTTT